MSEKDIPKWRSFESSTELGWPLHVGMRKGCDSLASSLAWNLVHVFDKQWHVFLECVWKRLRANPEYANPDNNAAQIARELEKAVEDYDETVNGRDEDIRESMAFYCALKLLAYSDWEGITYYLVEKDKP